MTDHVNILVDTAGAAAALAVSERHFITMERSGRIGPLPIRLGRSVRYSVSSLENWAKANCPTREQWLRMQDGGEEA